jgi:hypothetical protein
MSDLDRLIGKKHMRCLLRMQALCLVALTLVLAGLACGGDGVGPTVKEAPQPRRPNVTAAIVLPAGDMVCVPTDTLELTVNAEDERQLSWVGYRIGAPANRQDSVAVDRDIYSGSFRVGVGSSWVGESEVTVFARDSQGLMAEKVIGTINVLDLIRRPFDTIHLGSIVTDLVFDAKRNALYLYETDSARVGVLDLETFTLGTPIPLPTSDSGSRVAGLDILPGNDTIGVALPATPFAAFIDLVTGTTTKVEFYRVPGMDGRIYASYVRLLSNRKAFVLGWTPGYGIWDYEIDAGTQERRTDIGISGLILDMGDPVRSGDHSKLLVLGRQGCSHVYDAETDTFSPCKTITWLLFDRPSGSTNGHRWLSSNKLYDGELNLVATVLPDDYKNPARGAIAPDGSAAYYLTSYGYQKVQLPGGEVLERVRIPIKGTRLTAIPDGERLVIWTDPGATTMKTTTDRITVVELR